VVASRQLLSPWQADALEGLRSFSDVLSGQQSEQLGALWAMLDEADGGAGLENLASNWILPLTARICRTLCKACWKQLADRSLDASEVSGVGADPALLKSLADDWAQWLAQARLSLDGEAVA